MESMSFKPSLKLMEKFLICVSAYKNYQAYHFIYDSRESKTFPRKKKLIL